MSKGKIIAATAIAFVTAVIAMLAYNGMFMTITVTEKEMGPYSYVYKSFVGPYSNTGPVFDDVNQKVLKAKCSSTIGIGIFYDNPSQVESAKLRSDCGVVLDPTDILKVMINPDLQTASIAKNQFVVAEFPQRSFLSYVLGPMKAYPAMNRFMSSKKYLPAPGVEIYDMKNGKILYMMQVIKGN